MSYHKEETLAESIVSKSNRDFINACENDDILGITNAMKQSRQDVTRGFYIASKMGNIKAAKYFILKGVDYYTESISIAFKCNRINIIELILEHNGDKYETLISIFDNTCLYNNVNILETAIDCNLNNGECVSMYYVFSICYVNDSYKCMKRVVEIYADVYLGFLNYKTDPNTIIQLLQVGTDIFHIRKIEHIELLQKDLNMFKDVTKESLCNIMIPNIINIILEYGLL
jgi:uncharacterized protein with FMN-binding domain